MTVRAGTLDDATGQTGATAGAAIDATTAATVSSKVLSDTYMGEVFDAQKTQRDTTLLASNDFTVLETMEIGSTTSLEIPATTTLEIIRYVTPTSVDNLYSKTLITPTLNGSIINGASVTGDIIGAVNNGYNLGDASHYWLNGYVATANFFNIILFQNNSPFTGHILLQNNSASTDKVVTFPDASGVVDVDQFITLTSTYTLTSQTAAQKLFNATTNGAITLPVGTYFFECYFDLSSMSSSSGAFGFDLTAGTATISGIKWWCEAKKTSLTDTATAPTSTVNTAANTAVVAANTTTTAWAKITGKVRISVAGTVTPQVSLGVAAAAVVGVDSYFRIWAVGSNTVTNVGNWS